MVSLDYEEKGILKYLNKSSDSDITIDDLADYLKNQDYGELSKKELRERLDHLIEKGYIRAKTEGRGEKREEVFSLTRYIGSGVRQQRHLQGRGIINDTSRLVKRLFGSIFVLSLAASIFFLSPDFTGNIIGNTTATWSNSSLISFGLFVFALLCGFASRKLK
jgi:hypothetical protein